MGGAGGQMSARLHTRVLFRKLVVGHLQLDELNARVKRGADKVWVWTAIAAKSKRLIAFHVGGRKVKFLYSIVRQGTGEVIRETLKRLGFTGIIQTAFIERSPWSGRELLLLPMPEEVWIEIKLHSSFACLLNLISKHPVFITLDG